MFVAALRSNNGTMKVAVKKEIEETDGQQRLAAGTRKRRRRGLAADVPGTYRSRTTPTVRSQGLQYARRCRECKSPLTCLVCGIRGDAQIGVAVKTERSDDDATSATLLADWQSDAIPQSIRRPWRVLEERMEEQLWNAQKEEAAARARLESVRNRGAQVAFMDMPEESQRE